jgi:hypothetical protein
MLVVAQGVVHGERLQGRSVVAATDDVAVDVAVAATRQSARSGKVQVKDGVVPAVQLCLKRDNYELRYCALEDLNRYCAPL